MMTMVSTIEIANHIIKRKIWDYESKNQGFCQYFEIKTTRMVPRF